MRGYEVSKGKWVTLHARSWRGERARTRTIDIEEFVDLADIDPTNFDHPYFLCRRTARARRARTGCWWR